MDVPTDNPTDETPIDPPAERPGWRRDVALFLTGQTVSLFGSMLVQYAVMWHLTLVTKSGTVMALAAIFGFLPQAIVSLFGGVLADRHNRKILIMIADTVIAASTLTLALLMLAGHTDLWLIYLTLTIRSIGAGIQTPAVGALIPQITPMDQLMRVNGLNQTIQSAMALLAPAAAGAIYAAASIVSIFLVDVVTAVIGVSLLAVLRVPTLARSDERSGYFADLVEGVRYIRHHAFLRWLLALFAVVFLLTVAPSYLTPLMLVRTFGDEVWKLTVLEMSFSAGMVVGGLVIAIWGGFRNRIATIMVASSTFGGLAVAMGLATNLWVFFTWMLIVGLAVPFFATPSMTLIQETVPAERQGRVFGFVGIVMAVAMPLGMTVFGPLADRVPVEDLLIGAGILMFVVVGLAALLPAGRRAMAAAREASG